MTILREDFLWGTSNYLSLLLLPPQPQGCYYLSQRRTDTSGSNNLRKKTVGSDCYIRPYGTLLGVLHSDQPSSRRLVWLGENSRFR